MSGDRDHFTSPGHGRSDDRRACHLHAPTRVKRGVYVHFGRTRRSTELVQHISLIA
jgi:hypothetical protein